MVKEVEGANPGRYVLAPAWHWAAEVKLFHFLRELLHTERPPATAARWWLYGRGRAPIGWYRSGIGVV